MSRRPPNPAADRAAQNQATIKNLLRLEPNKVCADCKRNKHPRWASWNLGVFVCIRCSGIHRGMGTHISRVKSVDLDSWTDEQMQSILSWGNARANKYWEAKLAAGHAPSEAKIENFIRTKYELKRWVMDGPMPDPSTLDVDGDDDVPLSLVKEKQVIERKESIRKASIGKSQAPHHASAPEGDLIGGDDAVLSPSARAAPLAAKVAPKAEPAAPKTTNTRDSLLGLDFLGGSTAPPRPASTPGAASHGAQSRPDLKQSILSLYASAPKPQPQQQAFGGMGHQPQTSIGGFNDAFGGLNLSSTASPKRAAADPFASLGSASTSNRATSQTSNTSSAFGGLSGGGFFDPKPVQPAVSHQHKPSNSGFGGFTSISTPPTQTATAPAPGPSQSSSSAMGDLFDLSAPTSQSSPPPPQASSASATANSAFALSSPQIKPAAPAPTATSSAFGSAAMSAADVWGSSEWTTPASAAATGPTAQALPSPQQAKAPAPVPVAAADFGWGNPSSSFANTAIVPGSGGGFNPAPKVTADEEFGGWASSTGPSDTGKPAAPKSGFGGDDDLFSNVWQ
ncbi:stromal membrane-associated protein [Metarhizium album ARSEF 1941]|uniref:Stromal membrane-associated protein n=1 Tax=Metarhizium album (strain ARSEF 1941) TaxID=1081103 RepID=A0A0B2WYL1_METAS|nr:stromal membrane-associated protein [Metarhizium album ARSEF 1941]KHN99133.1 stromal membrane-associated protein [Metarhizium album ARSEF 1941]